ncbi:MAG: hypothetical protein QM501_01285 [Gimesia sp.]
MSLLTASAFTIRTPFACATELTTTPKAQIAITFDLEMSRQYPLRNMLEWDFQKGNLNPETKDYSLKAAKTAKGLGGLIHYFCVGRVLEQKDVGAFCTSYWKLKDFLKSVELCVQQAIEQGGVFDFLCHPSIMYVEDPNFETIKLICNLVNQSGNRAEITGLSDIAKRVSVKSN